MIGRLGSLFVGGCISISSLSAQRKRRRAYTPMSIKVGSKVLSVIVQLISGGSVHERSHCSVVAEHQHSDRQVDGLR